MKRLNKVALGLVTLTLISLMVPLVAACVPPPGYTSLVIWKEISWVRVCEDRLIIQGWIHIQNDIENPAVILNIVDYVEAKEKRGDWVTLPDVAGTPWWFWSAGPPPGYWYSNVPFTIAAGGSRHNIRFILEFEKGTYKAYRNVVGVLLLNHPDGEHWFWYRVDFEVPQN